MLHAVEEYSEFCAHKQFYYVQNVFFV